MLDNSGQDLLFRSARTHSAWQAKPVSDETLRALYDLVKWGPTSANCSPTRWVFVRSEEGKDRLVPCMDSGNQEKTRLAPVTAILGMDMRFYEEMPRLFHNPAARSWFEGNPEKIRIAALRNSSLQGGYFIMAARALGLDCGPMSGFDEARLNAAFFPEGRVRANFVCNLGYGDSAKLHPRGPRFDFDEVCSLV